LTTQCKLGEGPFWEPSTNTLRFVDIVTNEVHTVDLSKGPSSYKVLSKLDISVGTTADIEGDEQHFAFGGKHGYGIINRATGEYRYIKKVWTDEEVKNGKDRRMRANDGAVDSKGRYWVGFMNDPLEVDKVGPEGRILQ
jgi:sugar lactone lactonase YvrE